MRMTKSILTASALALVAASAVQAQSLSSAGALAFDDADTLFVGDAKAGLVHAFDLGDALADQSGYQLGRAQTFEGAQSSTISMLRLQLSWALSQSRS